MTDDEIYKMITTQVTMAVWEAFSEMFMSIKTAIIKLFDDCYIVVTEATASAATIIVTAAGFHG